MKKFATAFLGLGLSLSLATGTPAQTPASGETVRSESGRFTVQLPALPEATTATTRVEGNTLTWTISQLEDGDSLYTIAYADLPLEMLSMGGEAVIESLQDHPLTEGFDWQALANRRRRVTQGEIPGMEFLQLEQGQVSAARLYLANRRLYLVMAADSDLQAVNQFLNSFTMDSIWRPYSSDQGRFSITIPMAPVASTQAIEAQGTPLTWEQFTIRNLMAPGDLYGVAYTDLPEGFQTDAARANLEAVAGSALGTIEGFPPVGPGVPITLNGYPGYEYLATSAAGRSYVLRFYQADDRVYSVLAVSRSLDNLDRFLSSFQVP